MADQYNNILVSACLLGTCCKWNGTHNALPQAELDLLRNHFHLIPVCPEVLGGLTIPREPAERKGNRVISKSGIDVTDAFFAGAKATLKKALSCQCFAAILKERSPSCGCEKIYDGSFSGILIKGSGITAQLLKDHHLTVIDETQIHCLL